MTLYQENINLQEALVREAKSNNQLQNPKPKSTIIKPPVLLGVTRKDSYSKDPKEATKEASEQQTIIQSEAYDLLTSKCKTQEEAL